MGDILYVVRLVISDTELNFFPLEVASFLVLRHVVLTTMFVEVHDLFTSSKSTWRGSVYSQKVSLFLRKPTAVGFLE